MSFNTTLVQLKAGDVMGIVVQLRGFNTTLVQLKVGKSNAEKVREILSFNTTLVQLKGRLLQSF